MSLPLVPHALGMVKHTLAPEDMGIEAGVALLFVVQAGEHKVQFRCRQDHRLLESVACQLAPELDQLAVRMWGGRPAARGECTGKGALPIGFATARRAIPLVRAVEGRATK